MRPLCAIILLCCAALPSAYGYAAFEEVIPMVSVWRQVPVDSIAVTYRVRPIATDRVAIDVRNAGPERTTLTLRLDSHQGEGTGNVTFIVDPAATASVDVAVAHFDRDLFTAPVTVMSASLIDSAGNPRPLPLPPRGANALSGQPAALSAITAVCLVEDPGFASDRLAVSLQPMADRLDVHLMNRSNQAIHCDLRIPDYQADDVINPRLHLLPGCAQEIVLPAVRLDARAALAMVQVWNVRIGEDSGPAIAPRREDAAQLPDLPAGWYPLGAADEETAAWNPRAVAWRLLDLGAGRAAALLRNQTALPLQLSVGLSGSDPLAVELPAHGEASVVLFGMVNGAVLKAHAIAIAGRPIPPPTTLRPALVPEHALPVTLREETAAFNPLGVAYTIARAGADRATVTIVNRTAAAVHAEWAIVGYQKGLPANPRLHLAAGASVTMTTAVSHSDARLAVARCEWWNVQVGADGP